MVKYSNEDLITLISELFPIESIMFIYYSGSIAYGLFDENSDYDVTVIVDGFRGYTQLNFPNLDLFIYGSNCYLDRFSFKEDVPLYSIVKMDDVLTIEDNLIYLNPNYSNKYMEYKNLNIDLVLYLKSFIEFQTIKRVNYEIPDKSMYHLFRIRGLLEHYLKYDRFEMIIEEPWKTKLITYKRNWNNHIGNSMLEDIVEQLKYIKKFIESMENK